MRLHSVITCSDKNGVTGIQFSVAVNPYSTTSEPIQLESIGSLVGECDTFALSQDIAKIKYSSNKKSSGMDNIRYQIDDVKKEYGDIGKDHITETFTPERPLIGLYGKTSMTGRIGELGFLKLDLQC